MKKTKYSKSDWCILGRVVVEYSEVIYDATTVPSTNLCKNKDIST